VTASLPAAVLFDLDGTLADTAPDLIAALERLRAGLGLAAIDTRPLRNLASRGAVAILEHGLPEIDASARDVLRSRFLDDYHEHCWESSRPFDGMPEFIEALERCGIRWGIVTNKLESLARAVVERAGWQARMACLIGGDSAARPKPAPDPVLAACRAIGAPPARTLFVGDDERDIVAGAAAGARTAAALWGYIADPAAVAGWGADLVADSPAALGEALGIAPRRTPA